MPIKLSVNKLSFRPKSKIVWSQREEGHAKQTSMAVAFLKSQELDFRISWLPHLMGFFIIAITGYQSLNNLCKADTHHGRIRSDIAAQ